MKMKYSSDLVLYNVFVQQYCRKCAASGGNPYKPGCACLSRTIFHCATSLLFIGILDTIMGKLLKLKPQLPFSGWKPKTSSDGEGSHSEKEKYVGPYDNSPIPRLTIHSFIMGMHILEYLENYGTPKFPKSINADHAIF
jgi:hypothetical protein